MNLKNHKYSKLWESNFFWEDSRLLDNSPKCPNFPICPLLQHFSCDWLFSFSFDILHEVEGSWEYFVICTQNWWSRIFLKNSFFVQKRAKKAQNDLIFICFPIMEAFFFLIRFASYTPLQVFFKPKTQNSLFWLIFPQVPTRLCPGPAGGRGTFSTPSPRHSAAFLLLAFSFKLKLFSKKRQEHFFKK